jgi:cytochrome bd-type quinol oxidase subunit 1
MTPVDSALTLFSFTMFTHILGASLVLGFSWFAFGFELIGRRRNDQVFVDSSRAISRAIVLIYATIGSLGTAITVELFTLWPGFMKTLGILLWWPFAFVAAMILSNFLFIAIYWYTFDRIRASLHLAVGFFMALTSSLIPFNFRTIIAFTNEPVGLASVGNAVETIRLYANPSLLPLFAHTLFASLSTAGFVVCAGAALGFHLKHGDARVNASLFRQGVLAGVGVLVPQALVGAWYLWTLGGNVPRMFAAITGLFTQYSGIADAQLLLPNIFATKLVLVGCLFLAGMWLRNAGERQVLSKLAIVVATAVGLLAPSIILIGETMQEYSHLPYLIIDRVKVADFLNAAFPLSIVGIFIVGFGIFIGILLAVLYVAYIKE